MPAIPARRLSRSAEVLAIDGRMASPAMAAALAQIDFNCRADNARKAARQSRIDADPRIIARRAAKEALTRQYDHGMAGAGQVFRDMDSGRLAQSKAIVSMIRARIALLDHDRAAARQFIREAMYARPSHWSINREALTASVVMGTMRLRKVSA
jgi:hypothetical protein